MASAWQLVQLYIGSALVTIASDVLLVVSETFAAWRREQSGYHAFY